MLDDQFSRRLTFPNVLVNGHQGFFTAEALTNIADTTIASLDAFERTGGPLFPVPAALTAHLTELTERPVDGYQPKICALLAPSG